MTKTYRSEAFAAIHETTEGLHEAGAITRQTMCKFDALCLTPAPELAGDEIKALRLREGLSQAVFARPLNVTVGLVSQWERGGKKPGGPALKLLVLLRAKGLEAIA
jgi:putative transcriptional regulator